MSYDNLPDGIYEGIMPDMSEYENKRVSQKGYLTAGKLFPYPIKPTLFKIASKNNVDIMFYGEDRHWLTVTYWYKVNGRMIDLIQFGEDVQEMRRRGNRNAPLLN